MTTATLDHKIVFVPVSQLKPYPRNARRHSKAQVRQIAKSIAKFGFTNPLLTGADGQILAGHGRVEAARLLGMETVPTIPLAHLSEAEKRAYVLADNKLALNAHWDQDMLAIELQGLIEQEFDVELTGFSIAETDFVIEGAKNRDTRGRDSNFDLVPLVLEHGVSKSDDLWLLGHHRLVCGDARQAADFELLIAGEKADLVFTDPPYNVKIEGNVGGLGTIRHREFAFASGEMTKSEFTSFLALTLKNCATYASDGAIAFVCMDWRHMGELLDAGAEAFTELKNLCVWNKSNGGMGTFYRSKHELVFVYKIGKASHTNSFELGQSGRYRTNVWDYAGISSLGANRADELAMHPTVKPVALIADAIKDCSKRGEIVLDCFGGSGSTLIAAETTGRKARLIEYDPLYCDTIIRRWQRVTDKNAIHSHTGQSFEDSEPQRQLLIAAPTLTAPVLKGQSGNPKGRPRKSDKSLLLKQVLPMSNAAIMSKVLNEQLTVIQNGKRRRVSKAEVVQRNTDKQAMTGSVLANRDLRRQLLAEDEKRRLEIEADHQLHHQYLRARTKALDDAKRDGTPLKEFWIEPEDIIFTPDAMEQVRGPGCVTDKPHFEFCERFLKLLIFELTYDICNFARENEPVRVAVKFIAILQKLITSAAERASNAYWSYLQDNYICFFHRLATKERELVWAAIGWPVPRKRWLPPTPEKDLRWLEKHRDPIQKIIFDLEFGTRRRLRRGRVIR